MMMQQLIFLSVLIAVILAAPTVLTRHLSDDIDNEIDVVNGNSNGGGGSVGDGRGLTHSSSTNHLYSTHPFVQFHLNISPKSIISDMIGSYIELDCEATGTSLINIQWLKDKQPIIDNNNYPIDYYETNMIDNNQQNHNQVDESVAIIHSRLIIPYLLPIHEGHFTCLAKDHINMKTADSFIYVINKNERKFENLTELINAKIMGGHHLPRITLWLKSLFEPMGMDVILPCRHVGNPKCDVIWNMKDGAILVGGMIGNRNGRYRLLSDGSLHIMGIRWADMGVYICTIENPLGTDFIETFLYPTIPSK